MRLVIESTKTNAGNYTDYYTIIGGTACDILLTEADLLFWATKDIDMILILENNFPEVAAICWEYIKEGADISVDGRMQKICTSIVLQKVDLVILP